MVVQMHPLRNQALGGVTHLFLEGCCVRAAARPQCWQGALLQHPLQQAGIVHTASFLEDAPDKSMETKGCIYFRG